MPETEYTAERTIPAAEITPGMTIRYHNPVGLWRTVAEVTRPRPYAVSLRDTDGKRIRGLFVEPTELFDVAAA